MIKIDISRDGESIADDIALTEEQAVVVLVLASILRVTTSVAQILRAADAPEEKENYPAFRKSKGRPKKPGPKSTRSRWGSKDEAERASGIQKEIQESDADRRRKEGEAKRERIVLTADLDENKNTRQDEPCLRVLGSPDATKEQADAYARCWRGDRRRGALCTKLKLAVQRMLVGQKVAAVEPDEPLSDDPGGPSPAAPEDDWGDDASAPESPTELAGTAAPASAPAHDPSTGEVPMRQPGDDEDI
jgi:hypothetical protein